MSSPVNKPDDGRSQERTHHTPGPWRFHDELIKAGGDGRQGKTIVEAPGQFHFDTDPEWLANARLIAAAPDLLRACKVVAEMAVSWEPLTPGDIAEVRAAIAKADACVTCNGSGWQTIRCRGGDIDKRACPHCPPGPEATPNE